MGPNVYSDSGVDYCFSVDSQVAPGFSEDSSLQQCLLACKTVLE